MITQEFNDFWQGFPSDNFFRSYISEFVTPFHTHPTCEIHIRFFSVFGKHRRINSLVTRLGIRAKIRPSHKSRKTINIWYTGENLKLPKGFDLTMSFKKQSKENIYWPLWVIYTSFRQMKFQSDREFKFSESKLMEARSISFEGRIRKACVFLTSKEDLRFKVCRQLEDMGLVDIYGASVNKKVKSKLEISAKYMFQICFENSSDDEYVTEKLFEAWSNGNIPIYQRKNNLPYINRLAMLEVNEINAYEIAEVINGCKDINEISSQPILIRKFDIDTFAMKLLNLIEEKCAKY